LYDDDGVSYRYEQGQRSEISVVWNDKTKTVTLRARQGTYRNMPHDQQLHVRLLQNQQWVEKDVVYSGRLISLHF
jgi:alpha-D-xyloside xylohydrolase